MAKSSMSREEFENLTDDEIMKMEVAPDFGAAAEEEESEPADVEEDSGDTGEEATAEATDEDDSEEGSDDVADEDVDAAAEKRSQQKAAKKPDETQVEGTEPKEPTATKETESAIDYQSEYQKIMAPFKANGRTVELKSPDEAIRLMQMGANYTKKLQALQPNLKLLQMLENNGVLDEGKLSYLIDLDKKDPKAIQKLLRDSGVDPMDIDTSVDPEYSPGRHQVSDEEMTFKSTLEEVSSDPVGKEMIIHINQNWDEESKKALWKDPNILRIVTEQKESGIYKQISDEIEQRRMLGTIPAKQPFINTYYAVGQDMQANGKLLKVQPNPSGSNQGSRVIGSRTAQKKTVQNSDKARAASGVKSSPKKVRQDYNPLSMSDEEFEKSAELARRL